MDLRNYIAISGMSGLYKVLTNAKNGVIVESLTDKKRTLVSANQKISSLDNISVFTTDKDVSLGDVLLKMKELLTEAVDTKVDANALRAKFQTVLSDFDKERVHDSDIKKMFTWFNILREQPDAWIEKAQEGSIEGEDKGPVLPKSGEKTHQHNAPKESGRVNTHGAMTRSVVPQKKGGG